MEPTQEITMDRNGTPYNTFAIRYYKEGHPEDGKVLRRINKNGVPISTEWYDEIKFYRSFDHAAPVARQLIESGYYAEVRKCNRIVVGPGKRDRYYLTA